MKKKVFRVLLFITFVASAISEVQAQVSDTKWYWRANAGLSELSNQSFNFGANSENLSIDSGFVAGLSVGYRIRPRVDLELMWEYRANDHTGFPASEALQSEGNFASNMFGLNAMYRLTESERFTPYLGVGLLLAQEIDIDFENAAGERSFSTDGDVGFQIFAGVEYLMSGAWKIRGELRQAQLGSLNLESESGVGTVLDLDYDPLTLDISILRSF
ncbi:MAG: OmpW family outer membrane protein [Pseudomonadota bacterium]